LKFMDTLSISNEKLALGDAATLVRETVQPKDAIGMPYIGLEHIEEGNLCLNGFGRAEDVTSTKFRFLKGDILFGKLRPYFRKIVRAPFDGVCSTDIWVVRTKPGVDQDYLFYWMASQDFVDFAMQGSEGTKMPRAIWEFVCRHQQIRRAVKEQRAIAHILRTLDDKIELNRRMNETLEAISRAIFKSWFVDFDPVIDNALRAGNQIPSAFAEKAARRRELLSRAKAEGRNIGVPKHIADLFPDRLVDSELGPIPAGWQLAALDEIALIIDCLHSKKPERREKGLPLLQLCNIRDDGLVDMSDTYYIDESDYRMWISRMEASPGDCVITNVGRVAAVAQIPSDLKAALGRNMTGIRCKDFFRFPTFLLESLLSDWMREEVLSKIDAGTILDALNVRNIPGLRLILPRNETVQTFELLARPLRNRMELNLVESFTLSLSRDSLLPKLISGEIRLI